MQCPSCDALLEVEAERCPACGFSKENESLSESPIMSETSATAPVATQNQPSPSKLIEFPGVTRSAVPQWRKEISERVREVQEKRAREAALETTEAEATNVVPQLELLPQAEVAPLNPLVTAALRRIERAHHAAQGAHRSNSSPSSVAVAYASENEYRAEALPELEIAAVPLSSVEPRQFDGPTEVEPAVTEKAHNLVVVPPTIANEPKPRPKPRRMIADNDPALNYLDSVPTSVRVEVVKYHHASALARVVAAIVDLMTVALLCSPYAALVELTSGNWSDWRVAGTAAVLFSVTSFLYFTISTALTGRTMGMRLLSMRIVDARTGLIPTGKQSAGRALVYLGTIFTLGLASLYVLIDRDRQTAQDRLTRTTVITA